MDGLSVNNPEGQGLSRKKTPPRKAERRKKQRAARQAVASGMDVVGIALAALAIIVMLSLLNSLIMWLRQDLNVLFADLGTSITDALLVRGRSGL